MTSLLRARETKMLNSDKRERMLDASGFEEAAKIAEEAGYGELSGMSSRELEKALNDRRAETLDELAAIAPDIRVISAFRAKYDYHNAKVIIKSQAAGADGTALFSDCGRFTLRQLENAVNEDDIRDFPKIFGDAIIEARDTLSRTDNPQLADIILDRAMFAELLSIASETGSAFLYGYVKLLIDAANLGAAVRAARSGRNADFLKNALITGGNVDTDNIIAAAGGENLAALYNAAPLENAALLGQEAIHGGTLTEFERACDNAVIAYLKKSALISFGDAPVIAYLAGQDSELTALRIILTGLKLGISTQTIRERLRDSYV